MFDTWCTILRFGLRQETQAALFCEFSLEDHLLDIHFVRSIDRHFGPRSIPRHLADFYNHTGRPSVDPELMARMLFGAYCFGIRSERHLSEKVTFVAEIGDITRFENPQQLMAWPCSE